MAMSAGTLLQARNLPLRTAGMAVGSGLYLPTDLDPAIFWYSLHPTYGTWTEQEASVAPLSGWTAVNFTSFNSGQTDPDGGSGAYSFVESTDGGPTADHECYNAASNAAKTYTDELVWMRAIGRDWVRFRLGNLYVYANLSTGATGSSSSASASVVDTSGAWRLWRVQFRGLPSSTNVIVEAADGDGGNSYTGNGTECFHIYNPTITQVRLSNVADLGSNGADLSQPTVNYQELFFSTLLNGDPIAESPYLQIAALKTTDAGAIAVASGDDPTFSCFGIFKGTTSSAQPVRWGGSSGNIYDIPLQLYGSDWESLRNASGTLSRHTYVTDSTLFDTPKTWAVVGRPGRVRELWVAGVKKGEITHDDLPSITMTEFIDGILTGSPGMAWSEIGVWPGSHTYAEIQPTLQALGQLWGGLAA